MPNHPNRPEPKGSVLPSSFGQALTDARNRAGLTQSGAAKLISAGLRSWQQWEAGPTAGTRGRGMHVNTVELWCIVAVAEGLLPANDPLVMMFVRPSLRRSMGVV